MLLQKGFEKSNNLHTNIVGFFKAFQDSFLLPKEYVSAT